MFFNLCSWKIDTYYCSTYISSRFFWASIVTHCLYFEFGRLGEVASLASPSSSHCPLPPGKRNQRKYIFRQKNTNPTSRLPCMLRMAGASGGCFPSDGLSCEPLIPQAGNAEVLKNTLVEKVAWKPNFFEFCNCCKWQVAFGERKEVSPQTQRLLGWPAGAKQCGGKRFAFCCSMLMNVQTTYFVHGNVLPWHLHCYCVADRTTGASGFLGGW